MSNVLKNIADAIYDGDKARILELADQAISEGLDPKTIINEGGVAGLERLGKAFDELEVFLTELMLGGEAMKALIEKITPLFENQAGGGFKGTVVIGCAKGDLHDIGINLVATQLEVSGFKVFNMGTDVSVNEYVDKAKEVNADIIAISSLLTTSAYYQEQLIQRLEIEGLRYKYKIIVGGGPITPKWARKIGADGYSRTANLAVQMCKELMTTDKDTSKDPLIYE